MIEMDPSEHGGSVVYFASLLLLAGPAAAQSLQGYELALMDLEGDKEVLGVLPPSVFAPRVSPDGERVVFEIIEAPESGGAASAQLWVATLSNLDERQPIPSVGGPLNWAALWTPDGERLVFLVSGERQDAIYWRSADGNADGEHLVDGRSAESWTPEGAQLTYLTLRGNEEYGISMLDMESGTTTALIDLPGSAQHSSNLSPNGEWIAFASNETGRFEVWVAPAHDLDDRTQVTQEGGGHPIWSHAGDSIYFDRDNQLFEVEITSGGDEGAAIGQPHALPIRGFEQGEYRRQFDLMPDGPEFLVLLPILEEAE